MLRLHVGRTRRHRLARRRRSSQRPSPRSGAATTSGGIALVNADGRGRDRRSRRHLPQDQRHPGTDASTTAPSSRRSRCRPRTASCSCARRDPTPRRRPSRSPRPRNGAVVSGLVNIAALASDNVAVTRVEFRVDGTLVLSDTTAPYAATWNAASAAPGAHTITATAYDAAGNTKVASVGVTVPAPADTTAPSVVDHLARQPAPPSRARSPWPPRPLTTSPSRGSSSESTARSCSPTPPRPYAATWNAASRRTRRPHDHRDGL